MSESISTQRPFWANRPQLHGGPALPWQACPLGAASHCPPPHCTASPSSSCELLQKDAAVRRLWEPRILATSKAGIRRARPNPRLFSFPSLLLMCVPHGLEGQVGGKRREMAGKCSIQPHPSLDEASQATQPGLGEGAGECGFLSSSENL